LSTLSNKALTDDTTTAILRPFFQDHPGELELRKLLDFMVQGKINRCRHTDHPTGCRSIRTNQRALPPSPISLQARCPSWRPANSVRALKATEDTVSFHIFEFYSVATLTVQCQIPFIFHHLPLLVGWQEGHPDLQKTWGMVEVGTA